MKKYSLLVLLLLSSVLFFASCSKNDNPDEEIIDATGVVNVSGDISTNTTWTADKIYLLKGFVFVTNGATLTIEPGTIIKGDKASKGSLIVTRGSKISAIGTVDKPIVFTSAAAAGARSAGDWGGIILLGKAKINPTAGFATIEGGVTPTGGGDPAKYIQYGGTEDNDNSGTLKYVRIEFGGIPFAPDSEINGLTLGGVGSGTTIDYVEIYRSGDDSFEWFGGSVNAKHLLSIGAVDDDFDTDFGFSGKVQFGLAQRAQVVADFSGSNGFESDNDATGTTNAPQTSAVFSNMTIVGPLLPANLTGNNTSNTNANFQHAAQIRRNSAISIANSIFTNYPEGIYIDDSNGTAASGNFFPATGAAKAFFTGNIIYGCNVKSNEVKGQQRTAFDAAIRAANTFDSAKSAADVLTDALRWGLDFKAATNALNNYGVPNFTVKAGSVAATGATFTGKFDDAALEKVTYKGAFGTDNWANGWAHFDPNTLPYTTPGVVK